MVPRFRRRRSSVVEHVLGKDGVRCSIHRGGTTVTHQEQRLDRLARKGQMPDIRPRNSMSRRCPRPRARRRRQFVHSRRIPTRTAGAAHSGCYARPAATQSASLLGTWRSSVGELTPREPQPCLTCRRCQQRRDAIVVDDER